MTSSCESACGGALLVRVEQEAVRRVGDAAADDVAVEHDRRQVAVAEARHLDRVVREQLARAGAVADGAGADAHGVHRDLQERVEGDDLVHVAAAQVHPVGEGVRELGGDRADLAANAAEVVEQPRPLRRQLLEQAREPEHVHAASLDRERPR